MARHGVPVVPTPDPQNDPAVRALLDMVHWVNGDETALERLLSSPVSGIDAARARQIRHEARERGIALADHEAMAPLVTARDELARRENGGDPAAIAFGVWERLLGQLVREGSEDRSLDALVSVLDGTADGGDFEPDLWRVARVPAADAVTIAAISGAAGCRWHTVVVAGCVEGVLPRIRTRLRYFDRALLRAEPLPTVAQRRRHVFEEERQLFCDLARSRATGQLVGVAAPEPGVLASRFIAGWAEREPARPPAVGLPPVNRVAPEASPPVMPGDVLPLSAARPRRGQRVRRSRLVGARDPGGVLRSGGRGTGVQLGGAP
jgi:hypothetical protein